MDKYRQIVKNPLFEQDLAQLGFDPVRADEFTEGAEWFLSREPRRGMLVAKDVWFLPMWEPGKGRPVNLYYTFNDENIFFLALRLASDDVTE
ncbi:MAG: hypothetical protein WB799_01560 [Candidatus Sulfotelmatobacter sp.]